MRTRLLPIGPVIRWTPSPITRSLDGVDTGNSQWASGRCLKPEEQRCGLLTTVAESGRNGGRSARSAKDGDQVALHRRISAVIKVQCADWQIDEVDGDGRLVHVTERPKGTWRKVKRGRTILIEDDPKTEFFTPGKSFSERSIDLGVYERLQGTLTAKHPLLRFAMYKEAYSTDAVLDRMRYEARIPKESVLFAEERDGFGCVSQLGTGIGVTKEQLPHASRHYSLHSLLFDPLENVGIVPETVVAPVRGVRFQALLRCVDVASQDEVERTIVDRLSRDGFVNYFPVAAFSCCENTTFDIARAAGKGNFYSACSMWLQSEAERNPIVHSQFLKYLAADDSTVSSVLGEWITHLSQYHSWRALVKFLKVLREGGPRLLADEAAMGLELFPLIPSWNRYEVGPAMFVWNAIASQRLLTHGARVVVGDVVRRPASTPPSGRVDGVLASAAPRMAWEYIRLSTEDECKQFEITDVVLPLPHPRALFPSNAASKELYEQFCTLHNFASLLSKPCSSSPQYRPIIVRPESLRAVRVHDPNSFSALKSNLFLAQEMKAPSLGVEHRIRPPCKYNLSPKIAQKLEFLSEKHSNAGSSSVAIECFLPRGAHPLSMLREVADVRHSTFHDLYSPLTIAAA